MESSTAFLALRVTMDALSKIRCRRLAGEDQLHVLVACALDAAGIEYLHEVRIAPRCRIDFLLSLRGYGVGIEIKRRRPSAPLLQNQVAKYLGSSRVDALLIVSGRCAPLNFGSLSSKPVAQLSLDALWGPAV